MTSASGDSFFSDPQRSNDQWIAELSGKSGNDAQEKAYNDLSKYLYIVIFNYLQNRAISSQALATFSEDELGEFGEDFVQDTIEKLARNDHSLLGQFTGAGSFTSWAAQIAKRIAATEIRRPYWVRRNRAGRGNGDTIFEGNSVSDALSDGGNADSPEVLLEQAELGHAIRACRGTLPKRYRDIFDRLIVDPEPVDEVAESLGVTVNAIYMLVYRVKRRIRACLIQKGYGPTKVD